MFDQVKVPYTPDLALFQGSYEYHVYHKYHVLFLQWLDNI